MNLRTYRAKTMQEALALVRRDLGPKASVLRTREVRSGGFLRWLGGSRVIEVVASASVTVPSRLPSRGSENEPQSRRARPRDNGAAARRLEPQSITSRDELEQQIIELQQKVDELCRQAAPIREGQPLGTRQAVRERSGRRARGPVDATEALLHDLVEADVQETLAAQLVERVRAEASTDALTDAARLKERLAAMLAAEIPIQGAIRVTPGERKVVALVGPTGVGKTTTIAKLAANYRLREKLRVGLMTIDTYRIAAVEQLRTYAEIIDLPLEIVTTPREMRPALARMADLDLILMDTAGRNPCDAPRVQELKAILAEAAPVDVHLVLSTVASTRSLVKMAEQFAPFDAKGLVLTKLDEAATLGNLLPLVCGGALQLSYLTFGQNVPDDIAPADGIRVARTILGIESFNGN